MGVAPSPPQGTQRQLRLCSSFAIVAVLVFLLFGFVLFFVVFVVFVVPVVPFVFVVIVIVVCAPDIALLVVVTEFVTKQNNKETKKKLRFE